jgi:hypothetical protein
MTPAEELKRLNLAIRQFESVFKSTKDPLQRERVGRELKQLKNYRDKLESFHEIDPTELEESAVPTEAEGLAYLRKILDSGGIGRGAVEADPDREIRHLLLYLHFFEKEFLVLLSETKLKLDFKHSLERDSYYHRFENLRRLFDDLRDDSARMDEYFAQRHEEDMRKRSFKKKHNVVLETDKFFRSLIRFSAVLVDDIVVQGSTCLNAGDTLRFTKMEGKRYLQGLTVQKALSQLNEFAQEVVTYLNVPQIESQDS